MGKLIIVNSLGCKSAILWQSLAAYWSILHRNPKKKGPFLFNIFLVDLFTILITCDIMVLNWRDIGSGFRKWWKNRKNQRKINDGGDKK